MQESEKPERWQLALCVLAFLVIFACRFGLYRYW